MIAIGADMTANQYRSAQMNGNIGSLEIDLPSSNTFDLRSRQNNPRIIFGQNFIVVKCFFIGRDDGSYGFHVA